jgi:hypothetical protein
MTFATSLLALALLVRRESSRHMGLVTRRIASLGAWPVTMLIQINAGLLAVRDLGQFDLRQYPRLSLAAKWRHVNPWRA